MAEIRALSVNNLAFEMLRWLPDAPVFCDGKPVVGVETNGPDGGVELITVDESADPYDAIEDVQTLLIKIDDEILNPPKDIDAAPPPPIPAIVAIGKLVSKMRARLADINPDGDEDYIPF